MLKLILKYLKSERKDKKMVKNWCSYLNISNENFLKVEVNKIMDSIKNSKIESDLKSDFYKMLLKEIKKLKG